MSQNMTSERLLDVQNLQTHFFTRRGVVKAVDGVSFRLNQGETLGLVGESGSGKSITCLSILRLVPQPAGRIVGGKVVFDGEDLLAKTENEMRKIRGKRISMILQDPMTSLNPVFTIGDQVSEPLRIHRRLSGQSLWDMVKEMLRLVRIPAPEVRMREYPHQMSGGMRQRIVGAMVLSSQPGLLIADEPTTSLDVTIQAQVLDLLKDIQQQFNVAMILVTHDVGIVANYCDRVAVMYAGRIVESAPVRDIFSNPSHPYTRALLNSLPNMELNVDRLDSIEGQPPELHALPPGCPFAVRCSEAMDICREEYPPSTVVSDGHHMSCWLSQV